MKTTHTLVPAKSDKNGSQEKHSAYEIKGDYVVAKSGGWVPISNEKLICLFQGVFAMWLDMHLCVNGKGSEPAHFDFIVDTALQQLHLLASIPWKFPEDAEKYYRAVKAIVNPARNSLTIYGGKYKEWRFYKTTSSANNMRLRDEIFKDYKKYGLLSISDPQYTKICFSEISSLLSTQET